MGQGFDQLLDSAIGHLQNLKDEGVKSLPLSQEGIAAMRELLQLRSQRADSGQGAVRGHTDQKPKASPQLGQTRQSASLADTVSHKVSKPMPVRPKTPAEQTAQVAEATDLVGRVDDWPLIPSRDKPDKLQAIRSQAEACQKCSHLAMSRQQVVFGVGDHDAEIMFVGEAPGVEEDQQGEPFVGKAGQLLTKIIQTMGLTRQDVYIANVLKCRPDTPGQHHGNRKPTPLEMQTCWPYLLEQIKCVRPKVIVALGGTAVEGLLGKKTVGITRLRGQFDDFRGIPLMPTYHPSYVLRHPVNRIKRQIWEDMLSVLRFLGHPISDQQESYFRS